MLISGRVILNLVVASNGPLQTNYKALKDASSNATYLGSSYVIEPIEGDGSRTADLYQISVYLEESAYLTPVAIIGNAEYVTTYSTISFSISDYSSISYENIVSITSGLETTLGVSGSVLYVAEISAEISTNISSTYQTSFIYQTSQTLLQNHTLTVDGVNNKFGYYVYTLCTTSSYKYYLYYYHKTYTNYDQLDYCQTITYEEDSDTHIYLSSNNRFINHMYYFETLDELNNFYSEWCL